VDAGAKVVCLLKEVLPLSLFSLTGTIEQVTTVAEVLEDFSIVEKVIKEFKV